MFVHGSITNGSSSVSVPFLPPAKDYIPHEKVVETVPDFGYQLYFADRKANAEVYNAVRAPSTDDEVYMPQLFMTQLPLFIPLLHRRLGQAGNNITRLGRMESVINGETPLDLQEIQASSFLSEKVLEDPPFQIMHCLT